MKKLLITLLSFMLISGTALTMSSCNISINRSAEEPEVEEKADVDEKSEEKAEESKKTEKDDPTVVGKWKAAINMGDVVEKSIVQDGGETSEEDKEMLKVFKLDELSFDMNWEFAKDGNFTISCDADSVETMMEDMAENMKTGMEEYLAGMLEGTGMTVDDALAESGMTIDSFIDELVKEMDISTFTELNETGTYELKDDELYIDGEKVEYELTEDTMIITSIGGDNPEVEILLPLTLKK